MNYLIFLIGEIYLDLQDNILLGIILFSLSMGFSLICRIWAFSITHNRPLGRADWAFLKGLSASMGAPLLWVWRVGLLAHFSNPINIDVNMGTF